MGWHGGETLEKFWDVVSSLFIGSDGNEELPERSDLDHCTYFADR